MRGNYELRVTNYELGSEELSVQEEVVRNLVKRCWRAVEALYGQAVDKGAAREELREVVRVVDGLARLALLVDNFPAGGGDAAGGYRQ